VAADISGVFAGITAGRAVYGKHYLVNLFAAIRINYPAVNKRVTLYFQEFAGAGKNSGKQLY
jgi:hypothetical protein